MYATRSSGPVEQLLDFLGGDFKDAKLTTIIHFAQCIFVVTVGCIICFGGTSVGGSGGTTLYNLTEEYILSSARYVFLAFMLAGVVGMIRDRDRRVGLNVFKLAFLCSCVAWWQTILPLFSRL